MAPVAKEFERIIHTGTLMAVARRLKTGVALCPHLAMLVR